MKTRKILWRGALAASCLFLLTASDCKTPLPATDNTPPVLTWSVRNQDGDTQTFTTNGTIRAKPGESFDVTLIAEDPEGVSRIELRGQGSYTCLQGNIGQTKFIVQKTDVQSLTPDANGKVLPKIFLLRDVSPEGWACTPGFNFKDGSLTLDGRGNNFHGGSTVGSLTISRG